MPWPQKSSSYLAALRTAWTPLNTAHLGENRFSTGVHLRILRSLSWADRAAALDPAADADLQFILRMIAFNSLWGQAYRPNDERQSDFRMWTLLLVESAKLDQTNAQRFSDLFKEHATLFQSIFDSEFFNREYWVEPGAEAISKNQKIAEDHRCKLRDGKIVALLWELPQRLLLIRGQLIHGNAKLDSSLNRATVHAAAEAIDLLLQTTLEVLIFDGGHASVSFPWDPVPYAPSDDSL